MIKENDRVVTLVDKKGFMETGIVPSGTIGVVVSLVADGKACEVEVWDETGYPMDVVTYENDELKVIPSV